MTHLSVLESLHVVEQLWGQADVEVLPDALDHLHGDTPLSCGHLLSLEMVEVLLYDVVNSNLRWQLEQMLLMDNNVPVIDQHILELLGDVDTIFVVNLIVWRKKNQSAKMKNCLKIILT